MNITQDRILAARSTNVQLRCLSFHFVVSSFFFRVRCHSLSYPRPIGFAACLYIHKRTDIEINIYIYKYFLFLGHQMTNSYLIIYFERVLCECIELSLSHSFTLLSRSLPLSLFQLKSKPFKRGCSPSDPIW